MVNNTTQDRPQTHIACGTTHRKTKEASLTETECRPEDALGREVGAAMAAEGCGVSLVLVAHPSNPSASGAVTGESQGQRQPSLLRETFLKTVMGFLLKVITKMF